MLSSSRRRVVRVRRRKTLRWPVWLSLALHLTLILALLIIPPTQPLTSGSEAQAVDFIVGEAQAEATPEPPAPTPAPAAPDVPPPPQVQQAEVTPPPPDVPPPPPVEQAEIPPPPPPPPPTPVPPPPKPVEQVHPPPAPPQRAATRAPVKPAGAPAHATAGQSGASNASDASNAAWMGKLKQWWDQHSYYPKEASLTNEGGNVRVHIVIAPDGEVTLIEVVQSSGLSVLDAAAVAVFRNAHLPPFPPGTPAQPADVVVTLHYRPADSGG